MHSAVVRNVIEFMQSNLEQEVDSFEEVRELGIAVSGDLAQKDRILLAEALVGPAELEECHKQLCRATRKMDTGS